MPSQKWWTDGRPVKTMLRQADLQLAGPGRVVSVIGPETAAGPKSWLALFAAHLQNPRSFARM